ncbi:hypothetical protein V6Z11_A02G111600 [Gossypium hirsutum]
MMLSRRKEKERQEPTTSDVHLEVPKSDSNI